MDIMLANIKSIIDVLIIHNTNIIITTNLRGYEIKLPNLEIKFEDDGSLILLKSHMCLYPTIEKAKKILNDYFDAYNYEYFKELEQQSH